MTPTTLLTLIEEIQLTSQALETEQNAAAAVKASGPLPDLFASRRSTPAKNDQQVNKLAARLLVLQKMAERLEPITNELDRLHLTIKKYGHKKNDLEKARIAIYSIPELDRRTSAKRQCDAEIAQIDLRVKCLTSAAGLFYRLFNHVDALHTYDFEQVDMLCDFLPEFFQHLVHVPACDADYCSFPIQDLVDLNKAVFGFDLPGNKKHPNTQFKRIFFPKTWKRPLRLIALRDQESLRMAGQAVGGSAPYCSPAVLSRRKTQLENQRNWLANTCIESVAVFSHLSGSLPVYTEYATGQAKPPMLTLAEVTQTPDKKLAKLHAFTAAIDKIALDEGLQIALITCTLPGSWHSNPTFKSKSWSWNGATPQECAESLTERFQNVRRDLDNVGVRLSGLWAAELHKDGTPHRHYWCVYRKEHAPLIRSVFLRYFPGKLRLRTGSKKDATDLAFMDSAEALENKGTLIATNPGLARSGFQVDVSIIDRSKGNGSSYVYKYIQKALLINPDAENPNAAKSSAEKGLLSQDAARSLWAMRSYGFFGIQNCLTLWDEVRRIKEVPKDPKIFELWKAARGCATVEITEDAKPDAHKFLLLNGGLAACTSIECSVPTPVQESFKVKLLKFEKLNRFGEPVKFIKGVEHVAKVVRNTFIELASGEIFEEFHPGLFVSSILDLSKSGRLSYAISRPHGWILRST
jgi:Bacteriophage replication gene A protein (GPA)